MNSWLVDVKAGVEHGHVEQHGREVFSLHVKLTVHIVSPTVVPSSSPRGEELAPESCLSSNGWTPCLSFKKPARG